MTKVETTPAIIDGETVITDEDVFALLDADRR